MTSFRSRPRFQTTSNMDISEIQQAVSAHLKNSDCGCVGSMVKGHIVLKIKPEDLHYWSPQLSLSLENTEEGTLIRGLYGPNPHVWALFLFGYAAIGILILFIGIIGFSQRSLGLSSGILWSLPVLAALGIGLYIGSQIGQKIGAEQTFTLHHFLEEAIEQKIHIH